MVSLQTQQRGRRRAGPWQRYGDRMSPATQPVQRPRDAKLLVIDHHGHLAHVPRADFGSHLEPGDLLVANDAATLPASLAGVHEPTGRR